MEKDKITPLKLNTLTVDERLEQLRQRKLPPEKLEAVRQIIRDYLATLPVEAFVVREAEAEYRTAANYPPTQSYELTAEFDKLREQGVSEFHIKEIRQRLAEYFARELAIGLAKESEERGYDDAFFIKLANGEIR